MKMFMFPMKTIEALPAEVKTYILLQIARNAERKLNENAEKPYADYDIDGRFLAEILGAVEMEGAEDEEDTNCGHSSGNT